MEFKQVNVTDNNGLTRLEDRFVSLSNPSDYISIQDAVHDFYHHFHSNKNQSGTINNLTMYKKRPIIINQVLLEYRAKNNGRVATDHALTLDPANANNLNVPSGYLSSWMAFLSRERTEELEIKRKEQRLNRRKWGDCPNTN